MRQQGRLLNILTLLCAAALVACGGGGGGGSADTSGGGGVTTQEALVSTPIQMLELQEQSSCTELQAYVSESIADLVLQNGFIDCFDCAVTLAAGAPLQEGLGTDAGSFDAFTGTNNQERGVDELDIIDTDKNGNFYLIDGDHLVVANGLPPADLREIASIDLSAAGHPEGVILDPANERLVVLLSQVGWFGPVPALAPTPFPTDPITRLLFVDVSDPENPVIDRRLKIKGFNIAVRRIDDRVHVVTHFTPTMPPILSTDVQLVDLKTRYWDALGNSDDTTDLETEIRARVDTLVASTDINEYLPSVMVKDEGSDYVDVAEPNCGDIAVPDVPQPFALTGVTSLDSDGHNVSRLIVARNAWTVYASQRNLYLVQTSNGWWFRPERQRQQTAVHKIQIGDGRPQYKAMGRVDGWVQSSYQLSEYDGFLRAVTTRNEFIPTEARVRVDNNLYVLEDNDARRLVEVGAVEGFGENETIFSSRLLGERGYVVTFRQIDPLFTFDLSDPRDPRLAGEVEIKGVSTYIHPLDDAHLLTIGFDGDENRLNGDFRLQIFDVRNLEDPRLIHVFVPQFDAPNHAWTEATYEPHAFDYFAAAGTLTIPLQYWSSDINRHFSGFAAFSVDVVDGFGVLGRLDHSDLARDRFCNDPATGIPDICIDGRYLESANPRRSVSALLGDTTYIYTLSNVGMKVSAARDFSNAIGVLPLPYRWDWPWLLAP
ncbi:MAG: beta-propeller domain-containing protein [Gammaproteobacteria bacterium]|nr:beta-propeller domain-containing protein [Gammaproteobacteria bacterium]